MHTMAAINTTRQPEEKVPLWGGLKERFSQGYGVAKSFASRIKSVLETPVSHVAKNVAHRTGDLVHGVEYALATRINNLTKPAPRTRETAIEPKSWGGEFIDATSHTTTTIQKETKEETPENSWKHTKIHTIGQFTTSIASRSLSSPGVRSSLISQDEEPKGHDKSLSKKLFLSPKLIRGIGISVDPQSPTPSYEQNVAGDSEDASSQSLEQTSQAFVPIMMSKENISAQDSYGAIIGNAIRNAQINTATAYKHLMSFSDLDQLQTEEEVLNTFLSSLYIADYPDVTPDPELRELFASIIGSFPLQDGLNLEDVKKIIQDALWNNSLFPEGQRYQPKNLRAKVLKLYNSEVENQSPESEETTPHVAAQ